MLTEERVKHKHKCPTCKTHKVYRASRHGWRDRILAWVNLYPYRCRECPSRRRFYSFGRE